MRFPSRRESRADKGGFTLLEMLIVLVVVGVMAGMASVTWNRILAKYRARGAIDQLRNGILQARSDAITRKRFSGILVDPTHLQFMRFVDDQPAAPNPQNGTYDDGEVVLQPWTALSSKMVFKSFSTTGITVNPPRPCGHPSPAAAASGGSYVVVFRPDGGASAALDARIGISSLPDEEFGLSVTASTGFVGLVRR